MAPRVGQVVNAKYRLLRHVGDGGMGSVYEARHETLGTTVALKFLHLELTRRQQLVQRFLQEARASAQIQSPHVVRVTDVDQTADGDVFIVLEFLEGKTLQTLYEELYKAGRRLAYVDALDYATQVLEGVEAAHRAGIVHRDLKPDNVMLTTDPRGAPLVKLLDFGIAKLRAIAGHEVKLTRPGVIMGTPEYMAPEQSSAADSVDARADIFSLGVLVFEMIAGQRPVGGEDPHELALAHRTGQISQLTELVPGVAPELAAAVHKAMAPRPEDRFATVSEMRERIEPFAAAVRPPSPSRLRAGGTVGVSLAAVPPAVVSAAPLPLVPPPAPEGPPRVAKTWPPEGEASRAVSSTMPDGSPAPAVPAPTPALDGGATQRIDQPFIPIAMAPELARPPRRRRRGTPIGMIIAGALAAASVVTGIAFLATRSSSSDDETRPRRSDPPATVSVGPQAPSPPVTPPPQPEVPAQPLPPPVTPPARPGTLPPRAPGSATPSATPSAVAPAFPLPIPSGLPFPLPFQPPAQPPPPPGSSRPQQEQPPAPPLFPSFP